MTPSPLVDRLASLFLTAPEEADLRTASASASREPRAGTRKRRARSAVLPGASVLVLGAAGAGPFALELAAALAARGSTGAALAVMPDRAGTLWWPALPGVAARRLAGRLAARDHAVAVHGRVVRITAQGPGASAEAARAAAAAPGCPVVLALGDELGLGSGLDGEARALAAHDLIVVTSRPNALAGIADLALASVGASAPAVPACAVRIAPRVLPLRPRLRASSSVALALSSLL